MKGWAGAIAGASVDGLERFGRSIGIDGWFWIEGRTSESSSGTGLAGWTGFAGRIY